MDSLKQISNGKLLMISDLEGCAEYDTNNEELIKQTTVLCEDLTFNALTEFLKENTNNKIAFLGDYFDKGPYVIKSINRIAKLKRDYPKRVHIILGNRDVNKLRFIYEFRIIGQEFPHIENPFFKKIFIDEITNETDPLEKLKLILKHTMGAGPPKYDSEKYIALEIDKSETDIKYLAQLLVSVFNKDIGKKINNEGLSEKNKQFIKNCRELYKESQIVHYDPYFKVLLSHAGGFTKENDFILSDTKYYKNILENMGEIKENNYFIKILETQKKLITGPKQATKKKSLQEVLDFHNNLLKASLRFDDTGMPSNEFILLQAMGLSGNPNYYSFIASCGLNGGCTLDFNINEGLIKEMKDRGIKFVASGHQPHCTTVPLIYKQGDVVFIANDTSNGYRPERKLENNTGKLTLKNIPLSFIEIKNDGTFECGICAIEPIIDMVSQEKRVIGMNFIKASDEASDINEIKGLSKDGTNDDYYKKLITTYENFKDIPIVVEENGEKILKDKNNETLLFMNKDTDPKQFKFYPLTTELTTELTPGGGKRKSKKNSKKSRRRTKNGKRTYKCLHGCNHR
jgi:hypothetical protein